MFWSVAPDQTGRRVFALAFTTLCGVAIGARFRWSQLVEAIAVAFAAMALLSLFVGPSPPPVGQMTDFPGRLARPLGGEEHLRRPDGLGRGELRRRRPLQPRRALLWWAMTPCQPHADCDVEDLAGRAAVGRRLTASPWWCAGPASAVVTTWVAVVTLVVGAADRLSPDLVFGLLGKDATLTGRTKIWAAICGRSTSVRWLGFGYGAMWSERPLGPAGVDHQPAGFAPTRPQ